MKDKIKLRILGLALFILLVFALMVVETYALFETDASGNTDFDIGSWVILLNNNDVTQISTLTLNSFTYVNSSHTQSGYFAPGSTGYFDLTIDASGSDVSVAYQIDVDDSVLDDHPNIYFSMTDLDSNQTVTTNSYSGLIRLSDASKVDHLRINLVWSNQLQYDEDDTSLIGEELEFPIVANFIQSIAE